MDDRIISYIYCFNELEDYFECHEYGESLWLDTGRPTILKGLIQAAVCLYHLNGGNPRGGWRMWLRARQYLAGTEEFAGMDVQRLCDDIDDVWSRVPDDLRGQSLTVEQVKSLNLPIVKIKLMNSDVASRVANWTLPGHAD